ncbi:uncharacterized protein V6R79_024319 [Siganus canaliculatus]
MSTGRSRVLLAREEKRFLGSSTCAMRLTSLHAGVNVDMLQGDAPPCSVGLCGFVSSLCTNKRRMTTQVSQFHQDLPEVELRKNQMRIEKQFMGER